MKYTKSGGRLSRTPGMVHRRRPQIDGIRNPNEQSAMSSHTSPLMVASGTFNLLL